MLGSVATQYSHADDSVVYVHDPMCSWCWAFHPQFDRLQQALPENIGVMRLLGGLAPDSDEPMPEAMCRHLKEVWQTIRRTVPGTEFNFEFWDNCTPRRSTYPACRAVIAARNQGQDRDQAMTQAIQQAYYLDARNPSDDSVLIEIAANLGLDVQQFSEDLNSSKTQCTLHGEIALSRNLGITGFPSLLLKQGDRFTRLPVDYRNHLPALEAIRSIWRPV